MYEDQPGEATRALVRCADALLACLAGILAFSVLLRTEAVLAEEQAPWREVFGGVKAANNYTTVYAGGGYAFGSGLNAPGWRLRAVGAWGRYNYTGERFGGNDPRHTQFDGEVTFLAAQVGYQIQRGRVIAKAFSGIEVVDQAVMPFDPRNSVQGTEYGLRLTLETWTDISDRWFLSADASYGSAFQEYWQLSRIGYRLGPKFAMGFEGGVLGNQEYSAGRGGGFIRGSFDKFEATVSGGFTGDYLLSDPSGYAALNFYKPF